MALDRRRLILGAGAAGLVAACSAARSPTRSASRSAIASRTPTPTESSTRKAAPAIPHGPAREVSSGRASSKQVALTFHVAGDPHVVSAVLAAARRANVNLTMLVVGQWLAQNPRYADAILSGGHDLGNHTWSHPVLTTDDAHMTRLEITRCRDLLIRLTGSGGRWFRPSGTPHATSLMLRATGSAGYPTSLSYSVDPLDYTNPGPSAVVSRVLAAATGGSIVSLHTLYAGTAEALPELISGLRARGLEPVAASRLLPQAHEGRTA